jgi:hypothetical protein
VRTAVRRLRGTSVHGRRYLATILLAGVFLALTQPLGACVDGEPTASPSASATASPTPTWPELPTEFPDCAVGVTQCQAAYLFDTILDSNDPGGVVAYTRGKAFNCDSPQSAPVLGLCSGAAPGEVRVGYQVSRGGHGELHTAESYGAILAELRSYGSTALPDDFGPGQFRLASIGCPTDPGVRCEDHFLVVFTYFRGERTVSFFEFDATGETPVALRLDIERTSLKPGGVEAMVGGGETPVPTVVQYGVFTPVRVQ